MLSGSLEAGTKTRILSLCCFQPLVLQRPTAFRHGGSIAWLAVTSPSSLQGPTPMWLEIHLKLSLVQRCSISPPPPPLKVISHNNGPASSGNGRGMDNRLLLSLTVYNRTTKFRGSIPARDRCRRQAPGTGLWMPRGNWLASCWWAGKARLA